MRIKARIVITLLLLAASFFPSFACQCPVTQLSREECDKYEIIFKGRVIDVKDCGSKPGEAVFQVDELYKGNAGKEFVVLFECNDPCAQKFLPGDEWVIYSRYKQISNAKMDWCSRSRKYFRIDKEDFYTVNYGNDYDDEVKFLRENLGLHRLLADTTNQAGNRNKKPDTADTVVILICSLLGIIVFYYLFNRFFK